MQLKPYLTSARETISSLRQISLVKKSGRDTIAELDLASSSDTFFILGSGQSINDLSEQQFQKIKDSESIGFNFWAVHPFVPSMYALQAIPNVDMGNMLASVLFARKKEYERVNFVMRGSQFNRGKFFSSPVHDAVEGTGKHYFSAEIYLSSKTSATTSRVCEALRLIGAWGPGRLRPFVPKIGASVVYLILFASQLGFRNVVLCGIDMNDSGHFYDSFDRAQFDYPIPPAAKAGRHPHMTGHGITVLDRIVDLHQYLQKFDINLWNASPNSQLMGKIPSYVWD